MMKKTIKEITDNEHGPIAREKRLRDRFARKWNKPKDKKK